MLPSLSWHKHFKTLQTTNLNGDNKIIRTCGLPKQCQQRAPNRCEKHLLHAGHTLVLRICSVETFKGQKTERQQAICCTQEQIH